MNVLIVNNMVPFVRGRTDDLAGKLAGELRKCGHNAEVLRVPVRCNAPQQLVSQMLLARWLELDYVDRVIALEFPSYLVRHPSKTLWIQGHSCRAGDDASDETSDPPGGVHQRQLGRVISAAEEEVLRESQSVFVSSQIGRDRLVRDHGVHPEVLLCPVDHPELFTRGRDDGYVFAGSRSVGETSRQHLLLEALAHADRRTRLVIAGQPDSADYEQLLRRTVERLGLETQAQLDLRPLSDEEYAGYVSASRAVAFVPTDDVAVGKLAIEAAMAGKALITTEDSGSGQEVARHGTTGWVTACDPLALADSLSSSLDARVAHEFGARALELWTSMGVTWTTTIAKLVP